MTASVFVKPRRARPFFGRHPWVFDGTIERVEGNPSPGDAVELYTHEKEFIAHGLFNPHSTIRVRLYSWAKDQPVDAALIASRIRKAVDFRHKDLGLGAPDAGCRLIYSESDGLSGLIVDRFADYLVVQFTSLAMARFESTIVGELEELLQPRGIYRRTERGIGELEQLDIDDSLLAGEPPREPVIIVENGVEFAVDVCIGQKTGSYLDQRDNHLAVCRYSAGRDVLDVFSYAGGFSLVAAKQGGAKSVTGIDSSVAAVRLAQLNAERNEITAEYRQEDASAGLERLKKEGRRFGLITCDPPKFARTASAVPNALRGYEQINRQAIELLEPGGVLATCSCSGHVSMSDFLHAIAAAAQRVGRDVQILEQRGQAPDHPVSAYCLETSYLKCVIARCVP
jgi:23S rRNA (cytosine1962-C5)-methyltransferase